jgi:hypothetical protein
MTDARSSTADAGSEGRAREDVEAPTEAASTAAEAESDAADANPDDSFERRWQALTVNQKKVIRSFLFQPTLADAAREVGLHPETVYAWDVDVAEIASDLMDRNRHRLERSFAGMADLVSDRLQQLLEDEDVDDRVAQKAASYVGNQIAGKPRQKQEVEHSGSVGLSRADADDAREKLEHLTSDDE